MKTLSDYFDYYEKVDEKILNEYKYLFERYRKSSNIIYFRLIKNIKLRIFNIEITEPYYTISSDDRIYLFEKQELDDDQITYSLNKEWQKIGIDKNISILHNAYEIFICGSYRQNQTLVLGSFPHVETLADLSYKDKKLTAKKLRAYLNTGTRTDINKMIELAQRLAKR